MSDWRICPSCPPDDNEWAATSFSADRRGRVCDACWMQHGRVRVPCTRKGCRRKVQTLAGVARPMCRSCRRRVKPFRAYIKAVQKRARENPKNYTRCRKDCSGCGRRVQTHVGCVAPRCRGCRRAAAQALTAPRAADTAPHLKGPEPMPDEMQEVTLETLGRGGAVELFNAELERAIGDCLDPNADPKAARTVQLTVKVKPTEDRTAASVDYKVTAKLAGPRPQTALVYIGKEGGRAIALDRIQHDAFPKGASVHPINGAA